MAGEWETVALGSVTDLLTGLPFKSSQYVDDPNAIRLLRGDNIGQGVLRWDGVKRWPHDALDDASSYKLEEGDLVLAMDRPWIDAGLKYAAIRRSDLPALLVQRVARLRGRAGLETSFLKYVVGSSSFTEYVLAVQTGTAVPHISGGQIREYEFALPPLSEQRAIAHILGTLDDKIELNRRMGATLEAMARALFKSWFVDFEPVRAKVEGRDVSLGLSGTVSGSGGLPPHLAALFPDRLVETEQGKLPQGWSRRPLLEHARLISGGTPKTSVAHYWNGSIEWASAKDVSQCDAPFLITTERSITEEGLRESSARMVPRLATVVVARGATTGRFCMFGRDIAMNQTCYALASLHGCPFWLNCAFAVEVDSLVHAAHGSAFDTITTSTIERARATISGGQLEKEFEATVIPAVIDFDLYMPRGAVRWT